MILDLDKDLGLYPAEERLAFESSWFPGGEPHIRILGTPKQERVLVVRRINSFNDLGLVLVAVDALRRMGVRSIGLFIPYFPAARQDRVMVPGEALTAKVYADLVNGLRADEVMIFDPHSDVVPALLDRCTVLKNHAFIGKVVELLGRAPVLVAPDAGALKKIYAVSKALGGLDVVECSKSRDVRTGALSGFRIGAGDPGGRDCLIVDDICDGGGTFIGLAQELAKHGAGKISLAVSHGIFSKGAALLAPHFERIFTTDSIRSAQEEGIVRIPLRELIP